MARTDKRRKITHTASFEGRLVHEAHSLEEQAKTAQPGTHRDHLLRKARQSDIEALLEHLARSAIGNTNVGARLC
jgi:hypothetical protein